MGRIEELANLYQRYIETPWRRNTAGAQRVVVVSYDKELERKLRARIHEFEQRTIAAGHKWAAVDCTRCFADWMANLEYRDAYFEEPSDLAMVVEGQFLDYLADPLRNTLNAADEETVVGLTGVASLYGFAHVSQVVRAVESNIKGRLVVFFPGTAEGNNLRLLDARDGWNYLAKVISLGGVGGAA